MATREEKHVIVYTPICKEGVVLTSLGSGVYLLVEAFNFSIDS